MKPNKTKRFFTLILPLIVLLLFIGLCVESSVRRSALRKELTEMKENADTRGKNDRLTAIEERNKTISYIIGRDEDMELLINELKEETLP
jgi:hypothetical protein